jgi:L-lactate utilization protein LutB
VSDIGSRTLATLRCDECGHEVEVYAEFVGAWCSSCNGHPMTVLATSTWRGGEQVPKRWELLKAAFGGEVAW